MKRLVKLFSTVLVSVVMSTMVVRAADTTVTDNQSWNGEKAFNVPAGDVVTYSGTFTSSGTLVKTGEGKMVISSGNSTTFTGNVRIEGGTLALPSGCVAAMSASGEIRVEKGATLDISSTADASGNTMFDQGRKLYLAGTGVGDAGAMVRTTGGDKEKLLGMIELTDDATISINASYTSRRELTLNGHTLTVKGGGRLGFAGSTFTAGKEGDITVTQGSFLLQDSVKINGSAANTISVPDGGYLFLSNTGMDNALGWTFVLNGSAYFRYKPTLVSGPFVLNGAATKFRPNAADTTLKLDGPVSGTGGIVPYDSTSSILYLNNANNTFTGGVTWNYGDLHLAAAGSLPGYDQAGKLTVGKNASLYLSCGTSESTGTTGWSSSEVTALLGAASINDASTVTLETEPADCVFPYAEAITRNIRHAGLGTMTVTGKIKSAVVNDGGKIEIGGPAQRLAGLTVNAGEVVFRNSADVDFKTNAQTANGSLAADAPVIAYGGATRLADGGDSNIRAYVLAGTVADQQGLIRIENGAVVTNHFQLGNSGVGALHQLGGTSAWYGYLNSGMNPVYSALVGKSADDSKAYGYLGVAGGTLDLMGYTIVGQGANAVGVVSVKGNGSTLTETTTSNTTGIFAGREGGTVAVYAGDGGVLSHAGERIHVNDDASGCSVAFTAAGEGSKICTKHFSVVGDAGSVFMANMNDGGAFDLGTGAFRFYGAAGKYYLNFNGGIANCSQTSFIYTDEGYVEPTAMTVYEKGATFNLAADFKLSSPLLAPTGKSVKSIALPDEAASEKYLGAYPVTISGKGQGASAIADYDEATRTVRGIIVTSPGFGYDDETTATIESADRSKTYVCAVTLEDAKSGPLVKKGTGQLRLSAGNTYAGPTTIAEGEMLFEANAVNADHAVIMEEETILRLGADTVLGSISGCGEILHTSTGGDTLTLSSGVVVRAADLAAKRTLTVRGKLVFGKGAGVTFDDAAAAELLAKGGIALTTTEGIVGTPVVTGLPNGWRASVTADGKSLRLSVGGMVLVVR